MKNMFRWMLTIAIMGATVESLMAAGRGVLLLTFDDPNYDRWVQAIPLFQQYGAHASFFPNGKLSDHALAQMQKLKDAGHTIGIHTEHHGDARKAFAEGNGDRYFMNEVKPQLDAYARIGHKVRAMAYPNNRRNDASDRYLYNNAGITHFRAGHVVMYDPQHKYAKLDLVNTEEVFFPVSELPKRRVLEGIGIGESYRTDIDEILACIRRAAERDEVLVTYSHDIRPDAKTINMKKEWLERILKTAHELGVRMIGFDEIATDPASCVMDWSCSEWISVPNAPVSTNAVNNNWGDQRAASGTSWFVSKITNRNDVIAAKWTVAGLGVFDTFINGTKVGNEMLKPGFTHYAKTKYFFTYDVKGMLKLKKGEENAFSAAVSAGWWRDKIVNFAGRKSAFRGVLELTFADGSRCRYGTNSGDWKCGIAGKVKHAAIFDGEEYDAREVDPYFGEGLSSVPEINTEFKGELLESPGAEVYLRNDLAIRRGPFTVRPAETQVVDFAQNSAAVPRFRFSAKPGTVITVLPGEMLNDADKGSRGCDGPKGSVYRANLRVPNEGMRIVYTFAGNGVEEYIPSFSFFGYRYLSITATSEVKIESIDMVPVTSICKAMELGKITTGSELVNKLISNVYWGQLSNYLSVPTDCPQRNERLGWTADTQVFAEAGSFNADTSRFFRKWMRDMRDSQHRFGSFPGVAPTAQYGDNMMRIGWADAGIIVPFQMWKQFGDRAIVNENWVAMDRYLSRVNETKFSHEAIRAECAGRQWADWLSYEAFESNSGGAYSDKARQIAKPGAITYWNYLGACYWLWDANMMVHMANATGRDATKYRSMADDARAYLIKNFFPGEDGLIIPLLRDMQTPALFALHLGLVQGTAKKVTIDNLRKNFAAHGDCLQTGFLGTSILMDTLTDNGMVDIAYTLLMQRKNPSWLYSVDQGATTIWERWNSYTKERGFGPVSMNSFNHYAYGAVLAWMYKTMAGIAADVSDPGFHTVVMAPKPDRRVGSVNAEYRTPFGMVTSSWRYEGEKWIWDFSVPQGTTAKVTLPGKTEPVKYNPGTYHIEQ